MTLGLESGTPHSSTCALCESQEVQPLPKVMAEPDGNSHSLSQTCTLFFPTLWG